MGGGWLGKAATAAFGAEGRQLRRAFRRWEARLSCITHHHHCLLRWAGHAPITSSRPPQSQCLQLGRLAAIPASTGASAYYFRPHSDLAMLRKGPRCSRAGGTLSDRPVDEESVLDISSMPRSWFCSHRRDPHICVAVALQPKQPRS